MMAGSFWCSDPAAALRGLARGLRPAACSAALRARKSVLPHEDLAADLDAWRCVLEPQGQPADRAGLGGQVLARRAVAAGGGSRQVSVLVEEGAGEPVGLGFGVEGEVGGGDPERLGQAFCPGGDVLGAVGVVEGEHRDGVRDGSEGAVETADDAPDAGGRARSVCSRCKMSRRACQAS